jgi:hypothetical protein
MKTISLAIITVAVTILSACDDSSSPPVTCPDCKVQPYERKTYPAEYRYEPQNPPGATFKGTRVTMPDGKTVEPKG